MNGTSRLYRSTSERMLGGVAAGLGNYFHIDPNVVRLIFVALGVITGGGFAAVYLALWLLLPTAASAATDLNGIIHENLNDMGAQFRGLTGWQGGYGGYGGYGPSGGNAGNSGNVAQANNPGQASVGGETPTGQAPMSSQQLPQVAARPRPGFGPIVLIGIGVFLLLANMGFFRGHIPHLWWPLLFVGFGFFMLRRRRF